MISPVLFIQLSENDKRLIFVLLVALIVVLLLIGAIGYLITKIMKYQGDKLETAVYDVVVTKVITDEKEFKKYAWKKNIQMLLKQMWLPLAIIAFGCLILLIRAIAYNNWGYNPFNHNDGFGTILWVWDLKSAPTTKVFFFTIWSDWPPLINQPHLVGDAWASYIFGPCLIVGGIWYILVVQAFFARLFKTKSLSHKVFKKSLENYNQARGFTDGGPQINTNVQTNPQPQSQPTSQVVQSNPNPYDPNGYPPSNPM